ncbi:acyltransferase [Alteromonas macleodii]|uniref:acyltransferase n=1 Tax=Alteromonas macleodii TaxID=28108 RepID=UPI002076A420|nr:acyltransferase [Alteromonas macleodii]USI26655.1 acyltransferase [Alteromonas macleodii]
MKSKLSLAQYVKKRNGVPLGASGSMTNMLSRSFGAASFPISLATFLTFLVSGALHDLAVSIVELKTIIFFTPWFGLMGMIVVVSKRAGISHGHVSWPVRALIKDQTKQDRHLYIPLYVIVR